MYVFFFKRVTVLAGLRLSCDRLPSGYWKSAGSVVFLLLVFRADLLTVVAAWKGQIRDTEEERNVWLVLISFQSKVCECASKKC